ESCRSSRPPPVPAADRLHRPDRHPLAPHGTLESMADTTQTKDTSELLKQLRIDRTTPRSSRSRVRMFGTLAVLIGLVAAGLAWYAARPAPLAVQVAVARDAGQGPGPVL